MIPKEACHYTKAKTALKILATEKIRVGKLKFTNDPRESKEKNIPIFNIVGSPVSLDPKRGERISELTFKSNRIATEEWKVLCVSLHHPKGDVVDIASKLNRNIMKTIYNERLRQGYSHPRMWAQYADGHKGACLVFDGVALNRNLHVELGKHSRIFQGRVAYDFELTPIAIQFRGFEKKKLADSIRAYFYKYHKEIFLRKHPDWKDEVEYRWLVHNTRNSHEYVSVTDTIKAVFVGIDFPKKDESTLKALCIKLSIPVHRMDWRDGLPFPRLGSIYHP